MQEIKIKTFIPNGPWLKRQKQVTRGSMRRWLG